MSGAVASLVYRKPVSSPGSGIQSRNSSKEEEDEEEEDEDEDRLDVVGLDEGLTSSPGTKEIMM